MTTLSPTLKQIDETLNQYKDRLVLNKETLGLSWHDISQLWYDHTGEHKSDDYFRKYRKRIPNLNNVQVKPVKKSEPESNDIQDKIIQFEKTKYQVQDQKREFRNLIRNDARFDHLKDELFKAVKEVALLKPLNWRRPYQSNGNKEALVLFSDWHYGIESDNFFNKFNPDIFHDRVKELVHKTIEYGKLHGVKKLHVFNLGDIVSGILHVSVRVQNSEDIISQVKVVSEVMSEVLAKFASEFEEVKFYSVRGNHDRVTSNKHDAISKESFADIVPWFVQARTNQIPNLEVMNNTYDDEMIVAEVSGHTVIGTHGHKDKVSEVAQNLTVMLKLFPVAVCMGHYHHNWEKEFNGIDVIVNPSLSGTDEYARDIRKISKPAQKMLIFDETGQICTYKILL
ncbi:metallophosphoesterase [Brevibacillus sp. NRS-1366]|uniref:metallophosphoesterase n=1 Tax=Brevibacillus sp. NRS-1366 TaxID=3233899 RepID=UPI003D23C77B